MTSTSDTSRPRVRFRGTRIACPKDRLRADDALTRLWRALQGSDRMIAARIESQPLLVRSGSVVAPRRTAKRSVKFEPADISDPDEAKGAARVFWGVCRVMRDALHGGAFDAELIDRDGRATRFRNTSILYTRPSQFFGAGIVNGDVVLIDRKTFTRWLSSLAPKSYRQPSTKQAEAIVALLNGYAAASRYRFDRREIKRLIDDARERHKVSLSWVEAEVWSQLDDATRRLNGGTRKKGSLARLRRELLPELRDILRR